MSPSAVDDIDVLCIGESMIGITSADGGELAVGGQLTLFVGGAESNVAVGVSRAGLRAAWASLVGDDRFGRVIVDHVRGLGVETALVGYREWPTGVYFKSVEATGTVPLYYRAGSAASHMDAELARSWANVVTPRLVHVSGITAQISDAGRGLLRAVCEERVFGDATVSFDVNHRPALAGAGTPDELARLARASDIVFVGADEAERLWGADAGDIPGLLRGPHHLVVKDAASDATEYIDDTAVVCPTPPVEVVEAVGAGDAFAGGWLSAYVRGLPALERLAAGHAAAARVLGVRGDLPDDPPFSPTAKEPANGS